MVLAHFNAVGAFDRFDADFDAFFGCRFELLLQIVALLLKLFDAGNVFGFAGCRFAGCARRSGRSQGRAGQLFNSVLQRKFFQAQVFFIGAQDGNFSLRLGQLDGHTARLAGGPGFIFSKLFLEQLILGAQRGSGAAVSVHGAESGLERLPFEGELG